MININDLQNQIIKDFNSGMLCSELVNKYNLNSSIIRFLLMSAGINTRKYVRVKHIDIPIDTIKTLIDNNYTAIDISNEFNVSPYIIRKYLKEHNIKLKPGASCIKLPINEMIELYNTGNYTVRDLASKYYVSYSTIVNRLKEHNINLGHGGPKEKLKISDLEDIKKLYTQDKLSYDRIGKIYNCSHNCVRVFIKKHRIGE